MTSSSRQPAGFAARSVRFEWCSTPRHWIPKHAFATHFINVLHLLLPEGERWFCRVFALAVSSITSPLLERDVRAFMQQEAIHGQAHRAVLSHYFAAHQIDSEPYTDAVRWFLTRVLGDCPLGLRLPGRFLNRQWLLFRLGIIAVVEHFTCVLGKWVLEAKGLDAAQADSTMLDLLRWHGAEEVEHRHVAHELFQHLGGHYLYRAGLLVLVAPILLGVWMVGVEYFLMEDWTAKRPFSVLWRWRKTAGLGLVPSLSSLVLAALRYLWPGYHPYSEAETAQALEYLAVSKAARSAAQVGLQEATIV